MTSATTCGHFIGEPLRVPGRPRSILSLLVIPQGLCSVSDILLDTCSIFALIRDIVRLILAPSHVRDVPTQQKTSRDNEEVKTKFNVNWIGPYYVLEKKGHSSYILQHTESGRKTLPIHLRQLAKASPKAIDTIQNVRVSEENSGVDSAEVKDEDPIGAGPTGGGRPTRSRHRPATYAPMVSTGPQWQLYDPKNLAKVSLGGVQSPVLYVSGRQIMRVAQLQTRIQDVATIKILHDEGWKMLAVNNIRDRVFQYDQQLRDRKFSEVQHELRPMFW